jgi:hypothetical protein
MNDESEMNNESETSLDPPGSIAVIGAGPLGIEAALYGRFLGYNVTLIEATAIASLHSHHGDEPLPMLPDRSLSPLAQSALDAQSPDLIRTLPMTYAQWITAVLEPLTQTDLMVDRFRCPARVTKIETVPIEPEEGDDPEDLADIPPDYRITMDDAYGATQTIDVEAVIIATGPMHGIEMLFPTPADYWFTIDPSTSDSATEAALTEKDFWTGLKQIVACYAGLAGRADLDLYRPRRGT